MFTPLFCSIAFHHREVVKVYSTHFLQLELSDPVDAAADRLLARGPHPLVHHHNHCHTHCPLSHAAITELAPRLRLTVRTER